MENQTEKQITYVIAAPAKPIRVTLIPHDEYSFYRTKQIVVKSFRNRTVFQNLAEVEGYMRISAAYLIICFGYKLGVSVQYETTGSGNLFFCGHHDPNKLSKIFQDFVKEVLTCPRCTLPELSMRVGKDGNYEKVKGKCLACGHQEWMLEHNPKFADFVIKNSAFTIEMDNITLPKFSITKSYFLSSSNSSSEEDEELSFEEEVPQAAFEASQPSSVMKLFEQAAKRYGKSPTELSQVVFQIIFGSQDKHLSNLISHRQLLQVFLHSDPQRLNDFLEVLMKRLGNLPSTEQKMILKMLYDEEILDEEDVLGWFDSCGKTLLEKFPSVVGSVTIFVEWLRQPADESDG